jgi:hypothetical protein
VLYTARFGEPNCQRAFAKLLGVRFAVGRDLRASGCPHKRSGHA